MLTPTYMSFRQSQLKYRCLTLHGSKIKHISETNTDIKLFASAYSMVTFPVFFLVGQGVF
jgi:hypothetical protein